MDDRRIDVPVGHGDKGRAGIMVPTIIASIALFLALATFAANARRQFWLVRLKRQVDGHQAETRAKWAEVSRILGIKGE